MGAYYTPPLLPRRAGLLRLAMENPWAVAGLVLAQLMVVLLYLIMVDSLRQVDDRRAMQEQQSRQRQACTLLPRRADRDQCLATLKKFVGNTVPALVQK